MSEAPAQAAAPQAGATEAPPGWEGILEPGERILWQGAPDPRPRLTPGNLITALFGLVFAGFAVFWMLAALGAGAGWGALFGLPHLAIGAGLAWWAVWGRVFRLRRSFYTLTDRRAFIATRWPLLGRRLEIWPIEPGAPITYVPPEDGRPGSVFFATRTVVRSHHDPDERGPWLRRSIERRPVGFEDIPDAEKVLGLIRRIQEGAA